MKTLWVRLSFVVAWLISLIGVQSASAKYIDNYNQRAAEIKNTTPLYLSMKTDYSKTKTQKVGDMLSWHYSHGSHEYHHSHYSHRSGY
jgi:hypothetical protein